jgi:hypothetical protein
MANQRPDLSHAIWRRSTQSSSTGQNCVEVATNIAGIVAIRDSENPDGPTIATTRRRWEEFTGGVKDGEFEPG